MKRAVKKVLDKTSVDDVIARNVRSITTDRTKIDDRVIHLSKKVGMEVKKNIATAILAAFGFMIALVWRDVVKEGVNRLVALFGAGGQGFWFSVATAVITTIICVLGIIYFSRWSEKK